MKFADSKYQNIIPVFRVKNSWIALLILLSGLVLTFVSVHQTQKNAKNIAYQEFEFQGKDIILKIDARLKANALLLRSGAAFFAASDTVTREEWRIFIEREKLSKNLPGIQGVGYSLIIPQTQLTQHIASVRKNGFPEYNVLPEGDREIYTSIIYLEPFTDRNLRAFGYDMFSEPIRRKAMEMSRDSDYAMLSGKVILKQETGEDIQAGVLMYVPVYREGIQINTVEERKAAITGWVYSPFRINDFMDKVLGNLYSQTDNQMHIAVYDKNDNSDKELLYDSRGENKIISKEKPNLYLTIPIVFNGREWCLEFTGYNEILSLTNGKILIVIISGITISFLLFALSLSLTYANLRAKQIHLLNRQLEKLSLDKSRFISILSHDLINPFNNLLGLSEALKEDIRKLDIEEIELYANHINKTARNTFNLLESILIWGRAEQGKIPFKPQLLKFRDIYLNILEILNPIADEKGIKINYSPPSGTNVFADADMLKTVIRNLVSNAIKFTNSGGKINIKAEQNSEDVTISVSDNGIGISSDNLLKLFDISEVLSTKGTAGETGTGIGLLLCKEFIEKHGGKIWVKSEVGKGSDFKFTLPVSVEQVNAIKNILPDKF